MRASIEEDAVPDKWIVTLKKETNVNATNSSNYQKNLKGEFVQTKEQLRGLASAYRGNLDRVFHNAIYGMEVTMGEDDAIKMAANPSVAYVEQVSVVRFIQQSPATWGIDRIDQPNLPLDNTYNPGTADGTGITAYVIDTGVQITHDEFKNASGQSRASWGINTSGDSEDQDCHGHGTHVAGTVGGLQYGVAKNVNIVAVKVLQCSGSGSTAGVVAGVEWAMNHAASNNISNKAVANMSLGGGFSSATNTAVRNLHNSGVLTAVAAGNDNADACNFSPASEPTVITVGSTTSTDSRSSFSNHGSCLDIFAPGSSITAAWIGSNSATRTISGTSMASPHVAGGLAVTISGGSIDAESDVINNATPGKVTNPQSNSPNLLLYISGINVPTPTAPTPTAPTPTAPAPTPTAPSPTPPTHNEPCQNLSKKRFKIDLTTDGNGAETTLVVKRRVKGKFNKRVWRTDGFGDNSDYTVSKCLKKNKCYRLEVRDSGADGICCEHGNGSFQGYWNRKAVPNVDSSFTNGNISRSRTFGRC